MRKKADAKKELASRWVNGYFCAVATALREEGAPGAIVRSLFAQGGGATEAVNADPLDVELFREHGLMP